MPSSLGRNTNAPTVNAGEAHTPSPCQSTLRYVGRSRHTGRSGGFIQIPFVHTPLLYVQFVFTSRSAYLLDMKTLSRICVTTFRAVEKFSEWHFDCLESHTHHSFQYGHIPGRLCGIIRYVAWLLAFATTKERERWSQTTDIKANFLKGRRRSWQESILGIAPSATETWRSRFETCLTYPFDALIMQLCIGNLISTFLWSRLTCRERKSYNWLKCGKKTPCKMQQPPLPLWK